MIDTTIGIIRFAQSLTDFKLPAKERKYTFWYETTQGTKKDCTDEFIDTLWHNWLQNAKGDNQKIDGFSVFTFKTPVKLNSINK